jgi:glycosyltransferase involved in cell wall biosynthesis
MSARLAVAIPFHSAADYLRRAIESVVAQDDSRWSLIVCDDGGAGEAQRVIESLGLQDDERIHAVRNDDCAGMVNNWNRCLDTAEADEAELVMLLHEDDALEPGYVRMMCALADAHPHAVALFCETRIIDAQGSRRFSFADWIKRFYVPSEARGTHGYAIEGEAGLRAIMAGNFIMCPTLCYRRSRLAERRFDPRWRQVQDLEMTSRLLLDGEKLVGTQQVEYVYRRHPSGATAQQSQSLLRFREEIALFDAVADRCRTLGWEDAARVSSRKRIVRLHLLFRALVDAASGHFGRARREIALALASRGDEPPTTAQ